jgi:hypothetical protein
MTFNILTSTLNFVIRLGQWEVPGALSVTQTAWRPYSMLQTVQRVTASACAYFGTGWTEKQDDSQIDEAKKNDL